MCQCECKPRYPEESPDQHRARFERYAREDRWARIAVIFGVAALTIYVVGWVL